MAPKAGLSASKICTLAAGERPGDLSDEEGIGYDVAAVLHRGHQVPNTTYNAGLGGLLVGGSHESIEAYVGTADTAAATSLLSGVGIAPVTSHLFLDLGDLLTSINGHGDFFGHDKIEGVAALDGGRRIVISNDSDFGISGLAPGSTTPPFQLAPKILPNGQQDDGEFLEVDVERLLFPGSHH